MNLNVYMVKFRSLQRAMKLGHFLNGVSVSDTRIGVDTRITFVGHLLIQKVFVEFLKILTQF